MNMLHFTVGQVLGLEILQAAHPKLVSQPGPDAHEELVRWMHILETARPEGLLPGGEFVLTTATFLDQVAQDPDAGVRAANQFMDTIEQTGAVAVVAEILEGRESVTEALTEAARHRKIPIYLLHKRIRFVELTQYVHENIAAARLQEVETDRRIHEAFTRLSVGSASTDRIVSEATALLGCQVVWEPTEQQTTTVAAEHQVVVAGDETLGRLSIVKECGADESLVKTVLERASQAVSISVLARRSRQEMRRSMASSLFYQLRGGTELSDREVQWRLAETFDLPRLTSTRWWPVVFRIWNQHRQGEELLNRLSGVLLEILEQYGTEQKLPVLAARSEIGVVDVLLPVDEIPSPDEFFEAARVRLAARLQGRGELIAGVGQEVDSAKRAGEQLIDAAQIAQAAQAYADSTGRRQTYFVAQDLGLRGLLAALRHDEHLVSFVAIELAGLLSVAENRQTFEKRLTLLDAILSTENKAALARSLHLSRPALYARIHRMERLLGYRLEDNAEQRTATHLALMAYWTDPDVVYAALRQRVRE